MSSRWREREKAAERREAEERRAAVRDQEDRHTHNWNSQFRCGCGASIAAVVVEQGEAIAALQEQVLELLSRELADAARAAETEEWERLKVDEVYWTPPDAPVPEVS